MQAICLWCKQPFEKKNNAQKYCCPSHQKKHSYRRNKKAVAEIKKCPICGTLFIRKYHKQKFCNQECRKKWKREYERERYQSKHKTQIKICPYCKEEFKTKTNPHIFCCLEHKKEYEKEQRILARKVFEPKICIVCGEEFTPHTADQQCCKASCSSQWINMKAKKRYWENVEKYRTKNREAKRREDYRKKQYRIEKGIEEKKVWDIQPSHYWG